VFRKTAIQIEEKRRLGKVKGPKLTPLTLKEMKAKGEKNTLIVVYDYPLARVLDECGVDIFLVGDSLATVFYGRPSDNLATMDEMVVHTQAVAKAAQRAFVVADMPFMSYQVSTEKAVINAGRLLQEGMADAVKLEGGVEIAETVRAIIRAGIPVMGHIGLINQAVKLTGVRKVRGKTEEDKKKLMEDAKVLEDAGICALGMELIAADTAREISEALKIPTNGIGAGPGCDGSGLNLYDILSLTAGDFKPKFVKKYADGKGLVINAVSQFISEVKGGGFPDDEHTYH
jgi:3-methyl-2-oxobutanoate hydroxymethyltransferase